MTTAPANLIPQKTVAASLRSSGWSFLWGAAMCLILSAWLNVKYDDMPSIVPWFTMLLGIAGLSVAAFHGWLAWKGLEGQWIAKRPVLALVAAAGGLALLLLAVMLVAWYGREALGEGLGAALFGCLALYQGFLLMRPLSTGPTSPVFETLYQNWMGYRNGLVIAGVGLFAAFIGMISIWKVKSEWAPAMAAVVLLSLVALIGAVWLSMNYAQLTPGLLRLLVLIQGGVAGLIVALAALVQVFVWREHVYMGGLSGWQGENGWKIWVCAYAGLFGLSLMFVSLLLARVDIRNQPNLRRALFGYNAVATGLLVLLALVLVNVVAYAMFPFTFNWTESRGLHTLWPSTRNILASLKTPTTVYVTLPEKSPVYPEVRQMLTNCQAQTNQLSVRYISPDRDFEEYKKLAANFPQFFVGKIGLDDNSGRGLLIVKGEHVLEAIKIRKEEVKNPVAFIPERRLFDVRPPTEENPRPKEVYNGEVEFAKELSFLEDNQKKRKLYFLQGNGELDIGSQGAPRRSNLVDNMAPLGASFLVDKLKKENYEVQGLVFSKDLPKGRPDMFVQAPLGADKKPQVPEDCYALVVAGASTPLPAETLEALERYLDRGGKMLVCLDMLVDPKTAEMRLSGIEAVLKKYGIKSANEMVVRIPNHPGDRSFTDFMTTADTNNVIAQQFTIYQIPIDTPVVVRPDPSSVRFKAEPLFVLDPKKKIRALNNANQQLLTQASLRKQKGDLEDQVVAEPLPVVVAVTEEIDKSTSKPRLVVFGDTDFLSNYEFAASFELDLPNYDLFISSLEWLAERPGVGARPKESNYFFVKKDLEYSRLLWWPFWLMLLGIVGLGGGVWIVRRR